MSLSWHFPVSFTAMSDSSRIHVTFMAVSWHFHIQALPGHSLPKSIGKVIQKLGVGCRREGPRQTTSGVRPLWRLPPAAPCEGGRSSPRPWRPLLAHLSEVSAHGSGVTPLGLRGHLLKLSRCRWMMVVGGHAESSALCRPPLAMILSGTAAGPPQPLCKHTSMPT